MRLFPAIKPALFTAACLTLASMPALAQNAPALVGQPVNPNYRPAPVPPAATAQMQAQQRALQQSGNSILGGGQQGGSLFDKSKTNSMTQEEREQELRDKNSPSYKASQLAKKARESGEYDRSLMAPKPKKPNPIDDIETPPDLVDLQHIREANGYGKGGDLFEEVLGKKMSLDLRAEAQKEAALSYGARGGLAKRSYQITERFRDYEPTFDRVYNFRSLLIRAPSGLLIEPPIVSEALDALAISEGGSEAAVSDQILRINKQAKIVTAPRDWRMYLNFTYPTKIAPPPKVLWPKNEMEQARWNQWVKEGWEAGYQQGEDVFESNLQRLTADFEGMVRYRMLLAEGKISQPYALQEDRGVTGGRNEMRVGDRALRITGPSQFLTGSDLWKPADR